MCSQNQYVIEVWNKNCFVGETSDHAMGILIRPGFKKMALNSKALKQFTS